MPNPSSDYPAALHTNTDISGFGSTALGSTSPTHTAVEGKQEEEIKAVQTKVGTGSSTPAAGKVLRATGTGTSGWGAADLTTDVTGTLPVSNGGTGVTTSTGSGNNVLSTSPTLVTPILGTPTSGVATNLTGTASGLTSGITNALKSATTTVDVSAATAPSTGQVLTATDSTHATWQGAAGGGSTPTIKLTLIDWQNPTAGSSAGMTTMIDAGSGSSATFSSSGLSLKTGTLTSNYAVAVFNKDKFQNTGYWLNKTYDRTWYATIIMGFQADRSGSTANEAWFGWGGNYSGVGYDTAQKMVGFRIVRSGSTNTIYAVCGTGSAVTATDVTTAINATTGFDLSNQGDPQSYMIKYTPTSVDFYCNGTKLTTITTNIPSGESTGNNLMVFVKNTTVATDVQMMVYESSTYVNAY